MMNEMTDTMRVWLEKGYDNLYLFVDYITYHKLLQETNIIYMNYIDKEKRITKMFGMTIYITDNVDGFKIYPKEEIPEILLMRMVIDKL